MLAYSIKSLHTKKLQWHKIDKITVYKNDSWLKNKFCGNPTFGFMTTFTLAVAFGKFVWYSKVFFHVIAVIARPPPAQLRCASADHIIVVLYNDINIFTVFIQYRGIVSGSYTPWCRGRHGRSGEIAVTTPAIGLCESDHFTSFFHKV